MWTTRPAAAILHTIRRVHRRRPAASRRSAAGHPRAGDRRRGTRHHRKTKDQTKNKQTLKTRPPSTSPFPFAFSPPLPQGTAVRFASSPGAVRPRTPPYFSSGRMVVLGGYTLRATTMRTSQRARRARGPEQAARFGFGVVGEPSRVTYAQARRPSREAAEFSPPTPPLRRAGGKTDCQPFHDRARLEAPASHATPPAGAIIPASISRSADDTSPSTYE